MLRPITAVLVAVVMSIILATGQVAASSQDDSQNVQTHTFSLWFQGDSQFDWNELFNQFYNGQFNNQPSESVEEPQKEPTKEKETEETAEQPQQKEQTETPQVQQPAEEEPAKEQVKEPQQEQAQQDQSQSSELQAFEQQVVELVNQERQKRGLQPLKVSVELSDVAREKSRDMAKNNYFSHTSPTYGSPFNMMKQFGIDYRAAGENIAMGQRSPEQVMNGWMNSDGHRKNILSSNFTHIGVGYVESNGSTYWTQMFIGK
ncbi:sporulation protein [Filobacillus milosensis]|uniref:Sporulation protein n=2 Tax=Filobacillus milosensis TaxID=94137 RepID=A0A4Y8IF01_9BACI|nr:CAP domain-containing protein [Filobacillus milosensis]TFB13398.1 sporulation protein [Filobacillus milosensis]